MELWTYLFAPGPLRVAVLVVVVWLWRRRARRLALWAVTTMAVGGALGALLKLLVGRDRPDLLDPVARAAGFSFPSGHALNAALAPGVLLLVFLPFGRDRPGGRAALWTVAVMLTVVTGLSRVALGVHWASDVLGGWLLGVAVLAATTAGVPHLAGPGGTAIRSDRRRRRGTRAGRARHPARAADPAGRASSRPAS